MPEFYFTPRGACVDLVERTPDPAGRRETRLVTTFTLDEARSIAATLSATITTAEDAMKATRVRRHAEREDTIRKMREDLAALEREHDEEQRELYGEAVATVTMGIPPKEEGRYWRHGTPEEGER